MFYIMKKIFLLMLVLTFWGKGFSQDTIVLYLDSSYLSTAKDSARYVRQAIINNKHYYITDRKISGEMISYYELSSLNPRIEDGLSVFYDEGGRIYSRGQYKNGEINGEWVYYTKNDMNDTVYYIKSNIKEKRSYSIQSFYNLKIKDSKSTECMVIDSLTAFIKNNFHLPPRAYDSFKDFSLGLNCLIGTEGTIKSYEFSLLIPDDLHLDILYEIYRILGLFKYKGVIRKPLNISSGYSRGRYFAEYTDRPFTIVEEMPDFQFGGYEGFDKYIRENLDKRFLKCNGTAYITFVVKTDGTIESMALLRGVKGCDGYFEEIERVIKSCPPWIPGKQRGRPVSVKLCCTIRLNE